MSDPFYRSAKWRALRAQVLRAHPVCTVPGCGRLANAVDHIVPRARGGRDAPSNLRAMCTSCHNRRTARGNGDVRAPGCDARGIPNDPGHWWRAAGKISGSLGGKTGWDRGSELVLPPDGGDDGT